MKDERGTVRLSNAPCGAFPGTDDNLPEQVYAEALPASALPRRSRDPRQGREDSLRLSEAALCFVAGRPSEAFRIYIDDQEYEPWKKAETARL